MSAEKSYSYNRPPDGMVVEPPLPQKSMPPEETLPPVAGAPANQQQVSMAQLQDLVKINGIDMAFDDLVNNGMSPEQAVAALQGAGVDVPDLAAPEYAGVEEPQVRRAEQVPQAGSGNGSRFDFGPFEPIAQAIQAGDMTKATQLKNQLSPVQQHVLERASYTEEYTAEAASQDANAFMQLQDRIKINQADPAKRAAAAAQQAELQEAYRQEVEYQRNLTTVNDNEKTSAERNAARMQLEGLAVSIGKRMNPKLGTSESANKQAKELAGYIGPAEFKMPFSNFGPRAEVMRRGSQDRLGLYRQQMEAAGVPVPEMAVPEAPPSPEDAAAKIGTMVLSQGALKDQTGNAVTIGESPVIRYPENGKTVFKKRGPGGGWIDLTAEEMASIGAQ